MVLSNAALTSLLIVLVRWAAATPSLLAVALVGSYARCEAHADSDVDLMFITTSPDQFRQDTDWLRHIAWEDIPAHIQEWRDVDYGIVWSRHLQLSNGVEVELSFGSPQWAAIDPIDASTQRVIQDGCWILLDPGGLLNRLVRYVLSQSTTYQPADIRLVQKDGDTLPE